MDNNNQLLLLLLLAVCRGQSVRFQVVHAAGTAMCLPRW
jgi:hypothetical protein